MPDNKTIAEKAARDVLQQAAELLGVPMRELKDHITPEGLQSLLQQSAIKALNIKGEQQ